MGQIESADVNSFQDLLIEPRVRLSLFANFASLREKRRFHAKAAKDAKKPGKSGGPLKLYLDNETAFRDDPLPILS